MTTDRHYLEPILEDAGIPFIPDWQPSEGCVLPPSIATVKAVVDLQMYQLMVLADMRRTDQQERYYSIEEIEAVKHLGIEFKTDESQGVRVRVREGMGS